MPTELHEMRTQAHARMPVQPVASGQWLGLDHIERCGGNVPAVEEWPQRRLVKEGRSRHVDQMNARLGLKQLSLADQAPALRRGRQRKHEMIDLWKEMFEAFDELHPIQRAFAMLAHFGEDAHVERQRTTCNSLSDGAKPEQPQRLALETAQVRHIPALRRLSDPAVGQLLSKHRIIAITHSAMGEAVAPREQVTR